MNILITGATGFAGSYLCSDLADKGDNVTGTYIIDKSLDQLDFLKNKVSFTKLDLLDKDKTFEVVKNTKPDKIFHLAALSNPAISFSQPQITLTNNIVAEINLLEAIKALGYKTKVLIIGSADEYGLVNEKNIPISETTPLNPTSPYAVSKITQEYLGRQYFNSYHFGVYIARPFNHIGPRQQEGFVVASFCKQIALVEKGKQGKLKVGYLGAVRDFTDVRDMVKAYDLLLEKGEPGVPYNIGSGKGYKISEILDLLISYSTKKIIVETDPQLVRPVENPIILANFNLFKKTTGWQPTIPLEKTLRDTLEYWRQQV